MSKRKPKPIPKINSKDINKTKESKRQYQNLIKEDLKEMKANNAQERWEFIKQSTINAAIKVTGLKTKQKYEQNKIINDLSEKQKKLLHEINSTRCIQ